MEQQPPKPMTPFDDITTPHGLYMLKLLLPYTPPSIQRMLAVFIKFSEFQYTLQHFRNLSRKEPGTQILSELEPYMDKEEKETLEQMQDMMNMMDMMQIMKGDMDYGQMDEQSESKEYGSSETGAD